MIKKYDGTMEKYLMLQRAKHCYIVYIIPKSVRANKRS